MRRLVLAPMFVIAAVLVTAATMFTAGAFEDSYQRLMKLEELSRRDVVYLEGLDAFAVWHHEAPYVLKLRHPIDGHWHIPDTVVYCQPTRIFESNDSWFDRQGRYLAGPAARSLGRVATKVSEGWVMVDPNEISPGPRRVSSDAWVLTGPVCRGWSQNWKEIAPHVAVP